MGLKRIERPKPFRQGLTIRQVGATSIKSRMGNTYFRLGGGVFTKKEILESRVRFARMKGLQAKRSDVGL